MVTHYAEPFGYIFAGSCFPRPGRPHPPRGARPVEERNSAGGADRAGVPGSRPAISKHLRLLRRAHLVQEKREGRHRLYQLNPEPLKAVDSWLQQYRVFWEANLNSLKAFVEAEHARETAGLGGGSKDRVKRSRSNE